MRSKYFTVLVYLALFSLCACTESFFFYPSKQKAYHPRVLGIEYRDIYLRAKDEPELHAWLLSTKETLKGFVLFCHGNAENISTHISAVAWLVEKGYDVLLFDYRGFGESQGEPTIAGVHRDAERVLDYVLKNLPEEVQVIVYGQSLGAAVCLSAVADSPEKERVSLVISESGFSSYKTIAADKLDSFFLTSILKTPLLRGLEENLSPVNKVKELSPVPLLVVHGEKDRVVQSYHARELYENAREPKEIWLIPYEYHISVFRGKANRARLLEYLRTM